MPITMYEASVPVFRRMLGNLLAWLDKADAHAQARRFNPDNYLGLRLAPDMLPFSSQVRIACDNAKGCTRRLAGVEAPVHPDDETTLEQLRARIRSTLEFIESVPAERFEGSETRAVEIPLRNRDPLRFDGATYLKHYALPNVYFHLTTAYALLRAAGVELGKGDFLGSF
jgi:uncharacterized protein